MHYSILIVEDSKLINDNLKTSLERDGHHVEQAFDFDSAVALVQSGRFNYILLDLILPDGEGEMLLPFAKRADARVIVMTTDRDSFRRERLFGFGIVDYIIKERYFDDIIDNIRHIFQQVESNGEYTVLVVDDSNFIRNNLELLLSSRGFVVLTASNGKEALETMEKYTIHALIADLEMPLVDGFALMGKLRRHKVYKNLPVMILTGSNDSNKIAKVIKHDVKDLIKKPYVIEELLLKVDNMMNTVKQKRIINEERRKFDLYHDAIVHSTLYMKCLPDLKISYFNERLSELLYGEGKVSEGPLFLPSLVKNGTLELFRSMQKISSEKAPIEYIFEFSTLNQIPVYISATVSGIYDAAGKLRELIFIGHDITQLQQNENYLNEKIAEQTRINLEQQQMMFSQAKMAAMGEMIGNIAHQWRQPLTALALMIQDLEDAQAFNELNEEYVHKTVEKSMAQIHFMSKTIDDFRNFFQPDKQKERFDLADIVTATVEIIGSTLAHHSIVLDINRVEKGVFWAEGYKNEMQQVLLNLLNNAKDAIDEHRGKGDEVEKWIRIILRGEGDSNVIELEDNGGGVPMAIIERIFEPYFTTKSENHGTGIGLYMSKTIVEQSMGGKLLVHNTPLGACFQILLPNVGSKEGGQ
ncbi:MAG: response regulator [Sulfuricurvum sp.]